MNQSSHFSELMDPISLDWLEDPIALPCCGRAISRETILQHVRSNNTCPMCRSSLHNFNVSNAPKLVNIAYMVEQCKRESNPTELLTPQNQTNVGWKGKLQYLSTNNFNNSIVGKLSFTSSVGKQMYKTLLIPVIDNSGSMSGNPIRQVKQSLDRLLDVTYNNSHILTHMIIYESYSSNFEINKSRPIVEYRNKIQTLSGSGGTNFSSAFKEIKNVYKLYDENKYVNNVVIIFLTDGEDSSVSKSNRKNLVNEFKTEMNNSCKKDFVVHTVGFGGSHDYDFLNNLRMIGSREGAYRFADPSENDDCLYGKINGVVDAIVNTNQMSIVIKNSPFTVLSNNNDYYWLNLTDTPLNQDYNVEIMINNDSFNVPVEIESENGPELWQEYYAQLLDDIASELLVISHRPESLEKQLHSELLDRRCQSLISKFEKDSPNFERLTNIMESLKVLSSGGSITQQKLNDLKFEGKFSTKNTQTPNISSKTNNPKSTYSVSSWETLRYPGKRIIYSENVIDAFHVIAKYGTYSACDWLSNNVSEWENLIDANGANVLIVASSLGKIEFVRTIVRKNKLDINATDNNGFNATDLAALHGYWISYGILVENGGVPTMGQSLLRTCLSNDYVNTANCLLNDGFAVVTDDLKNSAPNNAIYHWLSTKTTSRINVKDAILKGMYEYVEQDINSITNFSWKHFYNILVNPSDDHLKIIDLLFENNKADPNEVFYVNDEDTTWPLFIACEKGNFALFEIIMKYMDKSTINKVNNKGTSALWIASCNKHVDIVMMLLQNNADPNISNYKGDCPLIPCCQKGSETIANILLDFGANIEVFNKNGDNPVLIACRTGQHKILELFLKKLGSDKSKEMLEKCALIDGFNPLLASTELDRIECIKMCIKYGADLEFKSGDDNQIIAGATALHLGCFYGRYGAVRTLYELGANLHARTNKEGFTPLHIAIKQGHTHIVKYLLSLPQGKECIEFHDNYGRTPRYYASTDMLNEVFSNKLANLLAQVIMSDENIEKNCAEILLKYGRSLGCHDYDEIHKINMGNGMSPLSYAILNGNKYLIDTFSKMNSNVYQADDYGVPPLFWATYFNVNMNIQPTDQITSMINNVTGVVGNNIQNKVLLDLRIGIPKLEYHEENLSTSIKMKDGYDYNISPEALLNLKKSSSGNHMLLGFIEKLKNNNVFSDGKKILEYVLWDSKIHLIKLLANGDNQMPLTHMLSLYLFSSNLTMFQQVNKTLCKWNTNDAWNSYVSCLYQAISLLPSHTGEVYRVIDTKFNTNDYAIDNVITWNNFSTCSFESKNCIEQLSKKNGIVFIIQSINGKNISHYSKNPNCGEVVFLPGTRFKIKNYYKPDIIVLGQANIRNGTYKITEKDIERAINGEAPIIIELEECNNLVIN